MNRSEILRLVKSGKLDVKESMTLLKKLGNGSGSVKNDSGDNLFYALEWEQRDAPQDARQPLPEGSVVIFRLPSETGFSNSLRDYWSPRTVFEIVLGTQHRQLTPGCIEIDHRQEQDYEKALAAAGQVSQVYFLGGLEPEARFSMTLDAVEQAQSRGVLSLVRLAKALSKLRAVRSLTLITNNVYRVLAGDSDLIPSAAPLFGLSKAIGREYPGIAVSAIDVLARETATDDDRRYLLEQIRAVADPQFATDQAFRKGRRYVRAIRPLILPNKPEYDFQFRERGVYLIAGGAGGIGTELSKHILSRTNGVVVLTGRGALDPAREKMLAGLKQYGGEALYMQADVTNPEQMDSVVRTISSRFGTINGVIHAAIVHKDQLLDTIDEATFRSVMDPKVRGSVVLRQVTQSISIEWMAFLSSVSALFGNPGQGNYAAGCAFKDAFANWLNHSGAVPAKTVNWGPWGQVGAVATPKYAERLKKQGVGVIDTAEGIRAFTQILASPFSQVLVFKNAGFLGTTGADLSSAVFLNPGDTPEIITQVAQALDKQAAHERPDLSEAESLFERVGQLGGYILLGWFRQNGVLQKPGETYTEDELFSKMRIASRHRRLASALVDILERQQFITRTGTGFKSSANVVSETTEWTLKNLATLEADFATTHPDFAPFLKLQRTCLDAYTDILTGAVQATSIMFPNSSMELVESIYKGSRIADYFNELVTSAVRTAVESIARSKPGNSPIRVLEVGAGTGGTTTSVLKRLNGFEDRLEYIYTDVSRAFTQFGRKVFGTEYPFTRFKELDIEQDPAASGFEPGSIDIVLATNVLHATKRLDRTMNHVQKLLHRRSIVVINEVTSVQNFFTFTFGLLDGWWAYEDEQDRLPHAPVTSAEGWHRLLHKVGFGAIRTFGLPHQRELNRQTQSVIIAESTGTYRAENIPQAPAVKAAAPAPRATEPMPAGPAQVEEIITGLLATSLGTTPDQVQKDRSFSEQGVDSIIGVEVVNNINDTLKTSLKATVLFDYPTIRQLAEHIAVNASPKLPAVAAEMVGQDSSPAAGVHAGPERPVEEPTKRVWRPAAGVDACPTGNTYRALQIARPGAVEDIRLAEVPVSGIGPDDVQISVAAFALNFGDLLCAQGLYPVMPPYPFTPGFEVAGTVIQTGANVTRFRAGDEVMAATGKTMGGHAEIVTTHQGLVAKKPASLSFQEASALPVAFLTAQQCLKRADLKAGETILIQSAAGGVGTMAVQLARIAGATIIGTAGSQKKLDYLKTIGVQHTINYAQEDFAARVLAITNGRGVDVVLNTLSGDAIQRGLDVLAPGGRYVELALAGLKAAQGLNLAKLTENQDFYTHNSRWLLMNRPDLVSQAFSDMVKMTEEGLIKPVIAQVFPFEQYADAFSYLRGRHNIGKVVVSVPRKAPVVEVIAAPAPARTQSPEKDGIAIIGISGRFPLSDNVHEFWKNLRDGKNLVQKVPTERWDADSLYDPDTHKPGTTTSKWGGFLSDIDKFDPLFFNISGKEAEAMDPQQRLFLEESWKALEDAGYSSQDLSGTKCGVFAGTTASDYIYRFKEQRPVDSFAFMGNAASILAARISYFLNLKGPSLAIDTACSSSLVAIHLACQSIRAGECSMALAGGVFIETTPDFHIMTAKTGMLSPNGLCKTFDDGADGFVPCEGVGALVLKRYSDAVRDGDVIYGVILGSGINQDGKTNGITAPSTLSQTQLELDVYEGAGINPETITYVEAHGTGTNLGDPIEVEALTNAFRKFTDRKQFCAIGSVKSNMGHAAAAAGVGAVIKVLMAMKHGELPPTLHCDKENSRIDFSETPFYVNREGRPWQLPGGAPRRAAISSFGFSGTNAHLVIEEPRAVPTRQTATKSFILPVSARTLPALLRRIADLNAWLSDNAATDLRDVSYTLAVGRTHYKHRVYFAGSTRAEIQAALARLDTPEALQSFIERLRASATEVGAEYMRGGDVRWRELFAGMDCRRISLPTYPFERERYWITPDAPAITSSTAPAAEAPSPVYLVRDWREAAIPNAAAPSGPGVIVCLIHRDQHALVSELQESGLKCVAVVGTGSHRQYETDFSDAHVAKLLEDLTREHPVIGGVVDLSDLSPAASFRVAYGKIVLLQALIKHHKRGRLPVLHLTKDLQALENERPSLHGADLHGLMKVLSAEYSQVKARTIDVDDHTIRHNHLSAIVRNEMAYDTNADAAYRFGIRFESYMKQTAPEAATLTLDPTKVYVVTGGTRGVGAQIAQHLVARGARNLVLMGIDPLPEREQWSRISAGDRRLQEKIQHLQTLEQAGARVATCFIPLTETDELQRYFADVRRSMGPIGGIVHSAMAPIQGSFFIDADIAHFRTLADIKIAGTLALAKVFERDQPDFFVLFSSIASVAPSRGAGCAAYSMVNSFLNAFAAHQAARGATHFKAINWVYWGDTGFCADSESLNRLRRGGIHANTNAEGCEAFDRVVLGTHPQVLYGRLSNTLLAEIGAGAPPVIAAEPQQGSLTTEGMRDVQQCLELLLVRAFQDMGVLASAGEVYEAPALKKRLNILPQYDRLFDALLDALERYGVISANNGVIRTTDKLSNPEFVKAIAACDAIVARVTGKWADLAPVVDLVYAVVQQYPAILTGQRPATDVLFPESSLRLVENVYSGNALADAYSELVARVTRERIQSLPPNSKVRILEIGAGTGSTTRFVLRAIQDFGSQLVYSYTDVSSAFLSHGRKKFGREFPFLEFKTLDIEKDPQTQRFEPGTFDIVIAANVLHATTGMRETIARVKSQIRPGGILILNELTDTPDWATLTFGTLDGWWAYKDEELRLKHSPLLSESTWTKLLGKDGFSNFRCLGSELASALYSQRIITGEYSHAEAPAGNGFVSVLVDIISDELHIARTGIDTAESLEAYGVDSIVMAQLVKRIEGALGISLNPGAILENPTIDALAAYISREHADVFQGIPEEREAQPVLAKTQPESTDVTAALVALFADELNIAAAKLDPQTPLDEFGVDSIVMAALIKRMESAFGVSLNPAILLENRTIGELSAHLKKEYNDVFERFEKNEDAVPPKPERPSGLIAVVGIACRFPGADGPDQFWKNLTNGADSITTVPKDRWDIEQIYRPQHEPGKSISKWGGFIDGIEMFDPGYFQIREEDAAHIDPLARVFLEECAWAVRDAGYGPRELWGKNVGVFVGGRVSNYAARIQKPTKTTLPGVSQNFMAAQVAQYFNFTGPNLVVDTACSSSLVGIHLACQSLRTDECEMAVAGGVEILLDENVYLLVSEAKAFSPDGKCHTFDEKANGFVPGEGCGVVLLKRLEKALEDGDRIYGVIATSATNNDGHTMGITTPNIQAQKALVRKALTQADINPATISYIEAHGTGTTIGDPIELKALTEVFRAYTDEVNFCGVGCVKTNFGHLASAAGVAGFIKAILTVYHRQIPPTLNCDRPNPRFEFATSPFYPNTQLRDFPVKHGVRRAAVSAFGLGGTNAHVIVEEFDSAAYGYVPARRPAERPVFSKRRFWVDAPAAPRTTAGMLKLQSSDQPAPAPAKRRPMLSLEAR